MHHEQPGGVLSAVAVGGIVIAALCTVALTTYAGARVGSPLILRILFGVWVLSPFAGLLTVYALSASWRSSMRVALHSVTLATAAGSSLAYAYFAFGVARPATAAFVLIPPASSLFVAVALATVAFSTRKSPPA